MRSAAELSLQGKAQRPKRLPMPAAVVDPWADNQPVHVRNCFAGTGKRTWAIWTWRRSAPESKIRVPYSCNSWRCPACAPHEAHVLWSRIREACAELDPRGFVFLVLTLDQLGHYDRRPKNWRKWHDCKEAYRDLRKMQQSLFDRLKYYARVRGWSPIGSKWVAVVEQHASGWPHVNLLLYHPELAAELEQAQAARALELGIDLAAVRDAGRATPLSVIRVDGDLGRMVVTAGWGRQSTAERARSSDALANYVTKVAAHAEQVANEVAKVTQAPRAAWPRFRRLRSGKGFLPKRAGTTEGWTGTLLRRQILDGTTVVLPVHRGEPEFLRDVSQTCDCEHDVWMREQELIHKNRKRVERSGAQAVLGPLVTHWLNGKQVDEKDRDPPGDLDSPAMFLWRGGVPP